MPNFAPIKAGGWAFGEVLTSGQMNQLNTDFPFAIDGRDGGTYTTSAAIIINGLTIAVTGGALAYSGPINATGYSQYTGGLQVTGGLLADSLLLSAGLVGQGASFAGSVASPAYFNFSGGGQVTGGLIADTLSLTDRVIWGGDGRAPQREQVITNIATTSVRGSRVTRFDVPSGILSADRIAQIDDTACVDGDEIEFCSLDAAWGVTVKDPAGTSLWGIVKLKNASGFLSSFKARRVGGSWVGRSPVLVA